MDFKKPDLKAFIGTNGTHGGRKGKDNIDGERPDGLSYYASIEARKAHADFCKKLGNGTLPTYEVQTQQETVQKAYTESRIAGRSGRGEKP